MTSIIFANFVETSYSYCLVMNEYIQFKHLLEYFVSHLEWAVNQINFIPDIKLISHLFLNS